jgi:hypothetical protein
MLRTVITDARGLFGWVPRSSLTKKFPYGSTVPIFEDQVQKRPNQLLLASYRSAAFS